MDISAIVKYDDTHPIDLVHPETGEKLGIVFHVTSADAEAVVVPLHSLELARYKFKQSQGRDYNDLEFMQYFAKQKEYVARYAIKSWDWGEHEFAGISGVGEPKPEELDKVVACLWIRDQVWSGVQSIANFTNPSLKNAEE